MQRITYEGHFNNGQFYASNKVVRIPERRRVIITILDDVQSVNSDKQAAWNEIKRMIEESTHENDLLTDAIFMRNNNNSGRDLIDFSDEGNIS